MYNSWEYSRRAFNCAECLDFGAVSGSGSRSSAWLGYGSDSRSRLIKSSLVIFVSDVVYWPLGSLSSLLSGGLSLVAILSL